MSADPVHWRDSSGAYRDVDLGLDVARSGSVTADVGPAAATLPSASESAVVLEQGDHRVSLALRQRAPRSAPDVDERSATYANVAPGVSRVLRTIPGGVKEDLRIASLAAPRRFTYDLRLSAGLTPRIDRRGDIEIRDRRGVAFRIPRGIAYEQRNPGESKPTSRYELETAGTRHWTVTVALDDSWAHALDRKWPVVLDPSVVVDAGVASIADFECSVEGVLTSRWGEIVDCPVGGTPFETIDVAQTTSGGWRSFSEATFKFDPVASIVGRVITDAALTVHATATTGTGPYRLRASRLTNHEPLSGVDTFLHHAAVPDDVKAVSAGNPVTLDVTPMVRGWYLAKPAGSTEGFPDHGMAITTNPGQRQAAGATSPTPYAAPVADYSVTLAASGHLDPAKRPQLDIHHAPAAQTGSRIEDPFDGQFTSRFVELETYASSANVTGATFEYRAGDSGKWREIPVGALREKLGGDQPTSSLIPVAANRSTRLVWDLQKTPGGQIDGPVHVRAMLDSGALSGGGYTPERHFRLDRGNQETSSMLSVGPGKVDLMTGNLAITETDAEIAGILGSDLRLTRTYNSRGLASRNTELFGPGWTGGFDNGQAPPYKGIYAFSAVQEEPEMARWMASSKDAFWESYDYRAESFDFSTLNVNPVHEISRHETRYVVLELNDGSKVSFRRQGGDWVADDHHSDLELSWLKDGDDKWKFVVQDAEGSLAVFERDTNAAAVESGSPQFRLVIYQRPGSSAALHQYKPIDGRLRLFRMLGAGCPGPWGLDGAWPAKCRALELQWGTTPVDGRSVDRVVGLRLRAKDPSGFVEGDSHLIATYSYSASGHLAQVNDPRAPGGLPVTYGYDAEGRLVSYVPPGERPWTFNYQSIAGDAGDGRIRAVTRKAPDGANARTTFAYDVPLAGSGAPNDLSFAASAGWAQTDRPWTATAVFPADAVPSGSGVPSSWDRATIHYLGTHGKTVNVADAEHNITTTEFTDAGKVRRELTAGNRARALAAPGSSASRAQELDTQYVYTANRDEQLGPERQVRRPSGTTTLARPLTRTFYDADATPPEYIGGPIELRRHLVTQIRVGARRSSDGAVIDDQVTTHGYSAGSSNWGWMLGKPLTTTVGEGAEAARTEFDYSSDGVLTEKRSPKASGSSSHAVQYHYYGFSGGPAWCNSVGSGLTDPDAAWGMLCAVSPAAAPSSGHPRPWTFTRYTLLGKPFQRIDSQSSSAAPLRITTLQQDALGRATGHVVWEPTGRTIDPVYSSYNATTGRLATTSSASAGTVSRTWDDNGRLATYTDANGGTTTYGYDLNGRLSSVQSPQGTRNLTYDDRDRVEAVTDSTLSGAITADRDADGNVVEQRLPSGPKATRSYDPDGAPLSVTWARTSGCSGAACVFVSSAVDRDAQGRIATHESEQSSRTYVYDTVGRLQREDDQRSGVCTRREHVYDKNSNRTSLTTRTSAPSGACGTGSTTTKTSGYDGADRLSNTGYGYDVLGRTRTVPASDSASGATTVTYDGDDLVATLFNAESEQTLQRDPMRRVRSEATKSPVSGPGSGTRTSTLRYRDDEDAPIGRTGSWGWERYVGDVDDQQLAVVRQNGDVTWQLSDVHGDVVALLENGATALTGETEYNGFGTWASLTGDWITSAAPGLTHAWLGALGTRSVLKQGSFVHMGSRVYNSVSGRFLQPSPLAGEAPNVYDYAKQDPLNTVDLDGR